MVLHRILISRRCKGKEYHKTSSHLLGKEVQTEVHQRRLRF